MEAVPVFVIAEHIIPNLFCLMDLAHRCLREYPPQRLEATEFYRLFSHLTWGDLFIANLLPVTISNIIGGAIMVGLVYWFVYNRKTN